MANKAPKNYDRMLQAVKNSYDSNVLILYTQYLGKYTYEGDSYHNILVVTKFKDSKTIDVFIERLEYQYYNKEWEAIDSVQLALGDIELLQKIPKINFKTIKVLYGEK